MFSLCIPTMERFDTFLKVNLLKYLEDKNIDEIIICDETGNDVDKINKYFPNNPKLRLFKNETRLGPFSNKLKACSLAKNEWIALIDSDNFADTDYFSRAKDYIKSVIGEQKNIILAPSKANPNFDYSHLNGFIYKRGSFYKNKMNENTLKRPKNVDSGVLMNTGNYVINKYMIDNINLQNESDKISSSYCCDVIYFNTLLFEQLNLNLHVVANLEYNHVVHGGSIYIQTCNQFASFSDYVHKRYYALD
jgi:hypothetical protein